MRNRFDSGRLKPIKLWLGSLAFDREDLLENHEQIGSQPEGNSKSPARELTDSETSFVISENNVKNVNDIR